MARKRTKKWALVLGVSAGVLLLLVVGGLVGWRMLMTWFVHEYYSEAYTPIALTLDDIGEYPPEYHLDDVPWFATQDAFCQGNSLQMIAAQKAIEEPLGYFNFLMGFTYGAVEMPGEVWVSPFTDPETGFVVAAPYLGLVRRYYTTNDEALYLDALRHYLSRDFPVRVGLDMAVLYDLEDQLPHSDVLVGYDETGLYYYETVCLPEAPCEPGRLSPGEQGLWVSDQTLLNAVLSQAQMLSYPWRYSLTVFEEGPLQKDLGPIWTRNGQFLIGGSQYGPRQGADAIEGLARTIENGDVEEDLPKILFGVEAAVYTRRDNAAYLRQAFSGEADIQHSADLFDEAADLYAEVLVELGNGIADQPEAGRIARALSDAAALERDIGQIFLARAASTE